MKSTVPMFPPGQVAPAATGTPDLLDVIADWYWEQDANLCFTVWRAGPNACKALNENGLLGRTWWSLAEPASVETAEWREHRAVLGARQPFRNFVSRMTDRNGEQRYISASGQAVYDAAGAFVGYRGIACDVTARGRSDLKRNVQHSLTRLLATSERLDSATAQAIELICTSLGWDCGAYWSRHPPGAGAGASLSCVQTWGKTAAYTEFVGLPLSPDRLVGAPADSLAHAAWAAREAVWVRDVADSTGVPRAGAAARAGLRSAFAFLIGSGDQAIGVMEVFSSRPHLPDTELRLWADDLGTLIAQFLERVAGRQQRDENEARLRSLIELSSDWTWEQDADFRFTSVEGGEGALQKLRDKGWTAASTVEFGTRRWDVPALNLSEADWEQHRAQLLRHEPFYDFVIRRPDLANGEQRWLAISGTPIYDECGKFKGYRGLNKDISERKRAEAQIQYFATHDALTGLPNGTLFGEILKRTVLTARRYERRFAVLFIDLDRFRLVNDSLGHDAGDTLLREMAQRLVGSLRASDIVARLGGDEFVVLLDEAKDPSDVEVVARNLLATLSRPVILLGQECRVTGSIGVCMYPAQASDAAALLKNADAAMCIAKEDGKNQHRFHSDSDKPQSLERMVLETCLRHAIERDELFLLYQPQLDLKTRRVTGVEALLRWQHPELGVVSPARFIPLAEETGLIVPIGKWVLQTACAQNVAWQRAGLAPLVMAVNVSARQLCDPGFIDDVREALTDAGMAPDRLELELTESMVMLDSARALGVLEDLKALGTRVAIDDFGTGYSSLAQLKRFPVDTLKIDQSFIADLQHNASDRAMVEAIVAMGKTLGLNVVAEGVETEAQQTFLFDHACDQIQGFYFSRPLAPDELRSFLQTHLAAPHPAAAAISDAFGTTGIAELAAS